MRADIELIAGRRVDASGSEHVEIAELRERAQAAAERGSNLLASRAVEERKVVVDRTGQALRKTVGLECRCRGDPRESGGAARVAAEIGERKTFDGKPCAGIIVGPRIAEELVRSGAFGRDQQAEMAAGAQRALRGKIELDAAIGRDDGVGTRFRARARQVIGVEVTQPDRDIAAARLHQSASFGHVQCLTAWMGVPRGASTRREPHDVDAHPRVAHESLLPFLGLSVAFPDERQGRLGDADEADLDEIGLLHVRRQVPHERVGLLANPRLVAQYERRRNAVHRDHGRSVLARPTPEKR